MVLRINHQVVVFDAADLAAESGFWAALLGGTLDVEGAPGSCRRPAATGRTTSRCTPTRPGIRSACAG
jgi:hypothetical protein